MTNDAENQAAQLATAAEAGGGARGRGSARATFLDVVNSAATRERIESLVEQALSMDGLGWAYCPDCGKSVQVKLPDVKKRIEALVQLLEQAEGKPGTEQVGTTVVVERPALRVGVDASLAPSPAVPDVTAASDES